ncbi:MAG: 6-carboxytetrahydropterin synthase QueD [Gammaproteobacteria bacterium]|nr:6-carboxytetrahydropterin synthase QueD [Gammaproteobacteria bacterium]
MSRYQLKVLSEFSAAHTLRAYPGACSRMHGHNWKVEVEVWAEQLDEIGMAIDFKQIRAATREVADGLDHRYLNDLAPFDQVNPTAENIAGYFYQQLQHNLDSNSARVAAVTLWETDRACVRFSEENQ